jgi:co-chaperonin GroES (HSP10)
LPHVQMEHGVDPKAFLLEGLGDISDVELFHNNLIVAIYRRPEKTAGGIILTDKHRDEDVYQGKIGMVVKLGPNAFKGDDAWNWPDIKEGDWVVFRPSDGWSMSIRGKGKTDPVLCRRLKDTSIEGRIPNPDMIW